MSREHDIVQKLRADNRFYEPNYDGPAELDLDAVLTVIARLMIRVEDLEARFVVQSNVPRTLVVDD